MLTFNPQNENGPNANVATLAAVADNGQRRKLRATEEGHLEIAIHDPRLPFGSIHTERLTPVFQSDAVYGINTQQVLATRSNQYP